MSKKYRWAILGTGKIGNRFAEALKNIPERAELWAVGSRSQQSADAFADQYDIPKRYDSYQAVMDDPEVEIVYVGTPGVFHARDMEMALQAGKHVLCEKAFTINAAEAARIIELARAKSLFLMEAMWTRFFPVHVKVRQLLAEGAIGKVNGLSVHFMARTPYDLNNRFFRVDLGAGVLLDLASYGISMASSLFGEPTAVTGLPVFGESGADYQAGMVMTYAQGEIATIICSQISYDVKDMVIFGETGKLVVPEPWYKPTRLVLNQQGEGITEFDFPLNQYNGYEYEALAVMDCLDQGKSENEIMPLDETLQIMETMDELRRQWDFKYPGEAEG